MMNYVAFTGLSKLDNLYVTATNRMQAVKVILHSKGNDLKKINDALLFHKEATRLLPIPAFFSQILYDRPHFLRLVIFIHQVFRFIYKCIYFYLFPYLVIPISYYSYDIFKWDKARRKAAAHLGDDGIYNYVNLDQFQPEDEMFAGKFP